MLFVWQAPLMCMSYSILCFLAGLSSVVISPLASRPMWNNDASVRLSVSVRVWKALHESLTLVQTTVIFLIAAVFAGFTFVGTSLGMHYLER